MDHISGICGWTFLATRLRGQGCISPSSFAQGFREEGGGNLRATNKGQGRWGLVTLGQVNKIQTGLSVPAPLGSTNGTQQALFHAFYANAIALVGVAIRITIHGYVCVLMCLRVFWCVRVMIETCVSASLELPVDDVAASRSFGGST